MNKNILTRQTVAEIFAAMQNSGLTDWELVVPEGVEEIEAGAFLGLKELRSVHLPKTLRRIGAAAFYGCEGLEQITLPKGLQQIETAAFWGCGLKTIAIPPRVSKWGSEVFAGSMLQQAEIKGTHLGTEMFRGCKQLAKVCMNPNIRKIEKGTFQDCTALKTLNLPEKLEQIGARAFLGCEGLKRLGIPESVKIIEDAAFSGCAFEGVRIPQNVETIHWRTFCECKKLKAVYFPARLKQIESEAFYGCEALRQLWFGADLKMVQNIRIGEDNEPLNGAVIHCAISAVNEK